jgi:tRNA-dihydrouridine synthase
MARFSPAVQADAIRRIHLAKQSVRRAHGRRDGPSLPPALQEDGRRARRLRDGHLQLLLYGSAKTQRRANHDGEVDPISVQIAGADPAMMAEAARHNIDRGAQIIDINMGCPAKKVCNVMAGSALMQDEPLVARILEAVVGAAGNTPVTLKFRTGWNKANKNAAIIARIAEESGIQLIAIHGRTRACSTPATPSTTPSPT